MDKYDNVGSGELSRTSRNQHIYSSSDLTELSRIKTNTNVSIISDAPKSIDLDKIRSYLEKNDEREEHKRVSLELPKEEEIVIVRKEEKDYDIKSVLDRARSTREINYEEDRHRKLNNTQIDILKSIRIKEKNMLKRNEELTSPIDELNTEEKTLVDLIQNIQKGKTKIIESDKNGGNDLFAELMGDMDDTMVMGQKEEISKDELKEMLIDMTQNLEKIKEPENEFTQEINMVKKNVFDYDDEDDEEIEENENEDEEDDDTPEINEVDKLFYTSSIVFDKNDFEGFDELEKESRKSSFLAKFAVFIVVLMLVATVFLIVNFVFDLNII